MNRAQCLVVRAQPLVVPTVSPVIPAQAGIQDHSEGLFQALHPLSKCWRGGRGVRPAPASTSRTTVDRQPTDDDSSLLM